MAAAACGGSQGANGPAIEPTANDEPAAEPTTPQSEPTAEPTTPQSEPTAEPTTPQPAVEPALEVAGCDDDAAGGEPDAEGEPVVELCLVAFGDTSFDGSGPDELIEGVRIVALATHEADHNLWWKSIVYFSRGRAFFGLGAYSGLYSRFLTGDIHPPGTGRVTVAGFSGKDAGVAEILVPFDQEIRGTVAVVKDEDIGEFWDAVEDGWWQQLDRESPPTWAPATLLVTGADGTVTTELAAGDYLFCYNYSCIYEDVTAGQDRILQPWGGEGQHFVIEHTEPESALLLEAIATCGTRNPRLFCATSEQYDRARQHYRDTGEFPPFPEGW